jgi:hypothetical protein
MRLQLQQTILIVVSFIAAIPGELLAEQSRSWTSADGKFTVEARLVEVGTEHVRLRKSDGSVISVPLAKLSRQDRDYVTQVKKQPPSEIDQFVPPDRIRVLPVFLVPRGQRPPTPDHSARFMRHVKWAQTWFRNGLSGRDSFELAKDVPDVVRLKKPIEFYKQLPKGQSAGHFVSELLDHYGFSRFKCPYIFCLVVMNPSERWPIGGGRTINGGINRGGGMLQISSFALDKIPNIQSTLRHEIAHACGLPHVAIYGYDMKTNSSVMAYNTSHRTNGLKEAQHPARLIPEDLRALALNPRVFPKLTFDAAQDLPSGYRLFPQVPLIGPMKLPDHPNFGPILTTPSGEVNGSKVTFVNREILPSTGPGITFRPRYMWASMKQPNGKIVLNVSFPSEIRLSSIIIHSQHSGKYNKAKSIVIEARINEDFQRVTAQPLEQADERVSFPRTTAQDWRLIFSADSSQRICLRGLQYFFDETQVFPPWVPYDWRDKLGIDLPAFPENE